jgi:hypothetical protein
MVSIAIAMILILGVNMVFKASTNTVSGGMALSGTNRQNLVVKTVLKNDLGQIATDGLLVIRSERVYAFRNVADRAGDSDGDPKTLDMPGQVGGIPVNPTRVNDRSHRLDRLAFFMRGTFTRQTAPPIDPGTGPLTWNTTSTEAWVWYGHLAIPNNMWLKGKQNATSPFPLFFNPAAPDVPPDTNDNNALAADWALGRYCILLVPDNNPKDGPYFWPSNNPLDPLRFDSPLGGGGPRAGIYDSAINTPIDVANTDIQTYLNSNRQVLDNFTLDWPNLLIGSLAGTNVWRPGSPYLRVPPNNTNGLSPGSSSPLMTPYSADLTSPVLVRGCVHFIVEYAGDYLMQMPNGTLDPHQPTDGLPHGDGQTDFYVDPATGDHKIRWYGFPRDVNNDGRIDGADVIPLRDLMPGRLPAPFERIGRNAFQNSQAFPDGPTDDPLDPASNFDYAAMMGRNPTFPYAYVCGWSQEMARLGYLPKMLRITVGIDDPNGRLNNAQIFQYTIDLQ